jgi:hypothetical protein
MIYSINLEALQAHVSVAFLSRGWFASKVRIAGERDSFPAYRPVVALDRSISIIG